MKYIGLFILVQLFYTKAIAENSCNIIDTVTQVTVFSDTTIKEKPQQKLLLSVDQLRYSPQEVNITQIGAGYSIKGKNDHLILKFNNAFSGHDYSAQLFSEYYHNFSKKDYINILLAGSDGKFFPAFIAGFSNFFVPGKGWELQAGARVYAPKNDSRSFVFPVGVSKQIDKHFFGYTLYMVEQKKQLSFVNNFNYRYYFKGDQFFSLNYGIGDRYNIFQPENVTDIPASKMNTQTVNALFTTPVGAKWNLELHFTYEHYKDSKSDKDFNIYMPGLMVSRKL
ncbi:YaiO family outer membrane beta-barrel protein [Parafilimonas terrae]|uniref:Outer membrane protein, YaiO family n=1 Tax=Parafilimonas terrae TaxID=1465490 RepID=A0A1I5RNM8_9BACT|nr:YaiO family outer membrane beta-barrel protein [Parafilimonas terrae]SFP60149.1 outer membrane protein, YaiO family [Parafilimonas terrae]